MYRYEMTIEGKLYTGEHATDPMDALDAAVILYGNDHGLTRLAAMDRIDRLYGTTLKTKMYEDGVVIEET